MTRHFPVVESKATARKPYWYARHDVTGSDLHYLPQYYSLAVPFLKVPDLRGNNILTLPGLYLKLTTTSFLTWKIFIIFQVVVVETILLHHSFTSR